MGILRVPRLRVPPGLRAQGLLVLRLLPARQAGRRAVRDLAVILSSHRTRCALDLPSFVAKGVVEGTPASAPDMAHFRVTIPSTPWSSEYLHGFCATGLRRHPCP